jgi:hypothetical protein
MIFAGIYLPQEAQKTQKDIIRLCSGQSAIVSGAGMTIIAFLGRVFK